MIYLFGGAGQNGLLLADLFSFNTVTSTWTQLIWPNGPTGRNNAVMVAGSDGNLYLFGGYTGSVAAGDFFTYNPATHTWTSIPATSDTPPPRMKHGLVATLDGKLLLIGGTSLDTGIYRYDIVRKTWANCQKADCTSFPASAYIKHGKLTGRAC